MGGQRWRVFAVFSRAIYLADASDNVRVLVDHRSPRGPLHLRIRKLPDLDVGDEVNIAGGVLTFRAGELSIEERWVGRRVSGLPSTGLRTSDRLDQQVGLDQLAQLARQIGGRGPGLTPEGDDVLAGCLLRLWHVDPSSEPDLVRVAQSVDTNRIASAFLVEAARGQCIEPAHLLLEAIANRDSEAILRATDELATYGASSGAALTRGIELWSQAPATVT